jgi:hypothetical protein
VVLIDPASTETGPTPPTPVTALTVQAARSPAEVEKQAYTFVQSYAASTVRLDQIARWRDPICVQVTGLAADKGAEVQARIEDMAKTIGRAVGKARCRPNVDIKFTVDPQSLLDSIAARQEATLGYYHGHDAKALKTVTRPIQAWYVTATAGRGGPMAGALFTNVGRTRYEDEVVDDPDSPSPTGCGESRFSSCRA